VRLTAEILRQSSNDQVDDAVNAVLDWLQANKPKTRHRFGPERKGEEAGGGEGTFTGGGGVPPSPGVSHAEVEGDEDGGVGDVDSDAYSLRSIAALPRSGRKLGVWHGSLWERPLSNSNGARRGRG
jgi:hypothetical protein